MTDRVPESALSPWQMILGDSFTELHPQLRAYFQAIPEGSVGIGDGVFDTVGTPRAWVRLLIRIVVDDDVLFPVWEQNVPFTVTNTPAGNTGRPAVTAERVFTFHGATSIMRDRIVATPDGMVDVLRARRRFRALFVTQVVDGGLRLTSTRMALRIGRRHLMISRMFAPRVTLTERFSDSDERQHVSLSVHAPLVGKVYEYAGSFRYEIKHELRSEKT